MSDYTGYAFKYRMCGADFTTKEQADSHYKDIHAKESK